MIMPKRAARHHTDSPKRWPGCEIPGENQIKQSKYPKSAIALITALLITAPASAADVHVLARDGLRIEIEIATDRLTEEFGPRFDRTAVVNSVTVDGVELLGPWGMSDEFGLYGDGVLGYDTADMGETFVKIGVGRLLRDTAEDYRFAYPYPIDSLFPVAVTADPTSLSVTQQSAGGSAQQYHYRKTYELAGDDVLVIRYALSNTGDTPWRFEHYNHHWFRVGDTPVGPAYRALTGFELPMAETGLRHTPFSLAISSPLAPGEAAYYASELPGVAADANRVELRVEGRPVIEYRGAFPPARFAVFANADGFCPEVFKRAALEPGETASWSATYRFTRPRP